ncbi:MAG: metallophosphoesterase family protein [Gemmatimonadales bacterium]
MKRWIFVASLVAACGGAAPGFKPVPPVEPAQIETSLFLIGDAGAPDRANEPVLRALSADLAKGAGERVVVYLGDNVYPRGLPDTGALGRAEALRRLDAQIDVVRDAGVQAIFVPGNHDWARMGADGWNSIRRQQRRIAERGGERVRLLPEDGCPGPVVVDVGQRLRIIALDTQWWLHAGPKPQDPTSECRADKAEEVTDSLRADLEATDSSRHVVVVAHHPLASGGEHGGYFSTRDYFFPLRHVSSWLGWIPLPGLGAIYPEARASGISSQDIPGGSNRRMREALEGAMLRPRPLVWASGHDHNLQVLAGRTARNLLVSGSGIFGHGSRVVQLSATRYASAAAGYMRLDLLIDGRVRLGVIEVDRDGRSREAYSRWLE